MSWGSYWKNIEGIDFGNDAYMWKFYSLLLDGFDFKGKKVLEIGCGTGINTVQMGMRGAKVSFLDTSKEALDIVKKTMDKFSVQGELIEGDAFDYNLDRDYDLVHSDGVVEHFKDGRRQRIIDIHSQVLRKGGKAVIIVPHAKCIPYRIGKFFSQKVGNWIYGNEYPYTRRELEHRMGKAGLKTESFSGGEFLFSFGWIFSPLVLGSGNFMTKAIQMPASRRMIKANYDNFFANRWGRIIGSVGVKK
jgi:2-polyprenyl-3-methyl-5-hydroxy-6-metoxy-1,4-benzoquinol methylase